MKIDVAETLENVLQIADSARELIIERTCSGFSVEIKSDKSFVTNVDLETERLIRCSIQSLYPDHALLGEEYEETKTDSDYQWIIDPIDGTHSFKNGIPLYGVLIALLHQGNPILGVIDHPGMDIRLHATFGLGTFCNGDPVELADADETDLMENEIIAIGERKQFIGCNKTTFFDALMQTHPSTRTYCDCFGHTLAIKGSVGAMVDFNIRLWDFAPTKLLVTEAGGKFVCIDERSRDGETRFDLIFGKPKVVDWIVENFCGKTF